MSKVLFVSMPFARTSIGSLALGTLKSICRQGGLEAEVRYLNLTFASAIGAQHYLSLSDVHDGEICFTAALFPDLRPQEVWRQYLELAGSQAPESNTEAARVLERDFLAIATRHVPRFLEAAMESIRWADYDIIGFSTGYNQTIASLALATRIRERHPEKHILLGGAACDGETGPALLEYFDVLDVVVSGEADHLIVPLLRALRRGEPVNLWPQVHARPSCRVAVASGLTGGAARQEALQGPPPIDMDALPLPDYDDYFADLDGFEVGEPLRIPYESSRGCWWGQKHQCSFCGLNGSHLAFRAKSAARVLAEIRHQYERYGVKRYYASDCILDLRFFQDFLPGLRDLHQAHDITTFYEVKSNLRTEQIHALQRSGVTWIQPGIESLSDHVLKLMNKGADGLNQVRVLRDCASAALQVRYGILWRNPGETADDYRHMKRVIPFLRHLPPPDYVVPVTLQRFSPYFSDPRKYRIENIQPAGIYRVMYGGRPFDYRRLSYIFTFDHAIDRDEELRSAWRALIAELGEWQDAYRPDSLICADLDGSLYVVDHRNGGRRVFRVSGVQREIFKLCAKGRTLPALERALEEGGSGRLSGILGHLVERRLILPWETKGLTRYLTLPVPVPLETLQQALTGDAEAAA